YFLKAIKFENNKENKLALNHKIAEIYIADNDLYNARVQNDLAYSNTKNKKLKSESYKTAATISQALFEFEEAFEFYQKHLELEQEFRVQENLEKQKSLELQTKLERSEKEIRLEKAAEEIKQNKIKAEKERLTFENQKIKLEKEKIELERETKEKEIEILAQEQKAKQAQILAQEAELKAKELESESQKQQLALATQKLEAERNTRELEEAQRQQELQELELKAAQDRELLKQQELEASQEAQQAQKVIYEQQKWVSKIIRITASVGGLVSLFIIGLVLWFLRTSKRKNRKLAQQNDEIEKQRAELETNRDLIAQEQEKSENLLLNILPAPIASELKEKGYATPKEYKKVTVLFTDFGGFTRISAKMDADELISELNTCFKTFDDIVSKYDIQPIKTIGDSYMCAGGVPIEGSVSPENMVRAALEILDFMTTRQAEKQAQNIEYWDTRIGLHTGSIIAGVVGKKKFAYDIWGDAVNTASRMESGAALNSINISEATYELVKTHFQCSYRGEFPVKNKGIMKMYQVDSVS
ncbi:MAG: adenylate/guanylate cyclase domain-containing protein, partial [Saprospiraceae bacterium]